mgnify:CR=1 FL=1
MKPDCLNERDLILLHYGETPDRMTAAAAAAHLDACPACRLRATRLAADLGRIPVAAEPDPAVATRIAARVTERLHGRRRWLPLAGAAVAGTIALATALVVWLPANQAPVPGNPVATVSPQLPATSIQPAAIRQAALDIDLLEQLDLLENLETLQAIEGV